MRSNPTTAVPSADDTVRVNLDLEFAAALTHIELALVYGLALPIALPLAALCPGDPMSFAVSAMTPGLTHRVEVKPNCDVVVASGARLFEPSVHRNSRGYGSGRVSLAGIVFEPATSTPSPPPEPPAAPLVPPSSGAVLDANVFAVGNEFGEFEDTASGNLFFFGTLEDLSFNGDPGDVVN